MALIGEPPPENLYGKQPRPSGGFKRGVHEIVKIVGGIAWPVGIVTLFVLPPFGILILLLAIVLTILSVVWTRQRRHDELIQAASSPTAAPTIAPDPTIDSKAAKARLAEIEELKDSGAISDDEYAEMRKRILDEI